MHMGRMQDLSTNAQIHGTDCGRMLNTDFEVFYNMDLDEDDFLSKCDVSAAAAECSKSGTYELGVKYASVSKISKGF